MYFKSQSCLLTSSLGGHGYKDMACRELRVQLYQEQKDNFWPPTGRHILAQYDDDTVVVYQAFCPNIAEYAVKNQR